MTLEEAQLILNVKKGDSMEKIAEVSLHDSFCSMYERENHRADRLTRFQNYERIFKANARPDPPAATDAAAKAKAASGRRNKPPAVVYSHYLQSKVFRALERIKAESSGEAAAEGVAAAEGAAAEAGGVAPETMAKATAEAEPFTGAGPGAGPIPTEGAASASAAGQAGASHKLGESASADQAGAQQQQATPESEAKEEKREPFNNPAVGRAKPKGDKVTDSNETIQL